MSSLEQRRNSPRRRISGGGMHPGWYVFFCGVATGIGLILCGIFSVQYMMGMKSIGFPIFGWLLWMTFMILGGRKAERLFDRDGGL